jgi:positive phototaxis protein PixI
MQTQATDTQPTDRLRALLPQLFNPVSPSGESFLRLQVADDLAVVIALDWIEETRLVGRSDLTPMPGMPPHVLGLMGAKGQVFWLLSLAHLLGETSRPLLNHRYEVVVIRVFQGADQQEELLLGLAVQQINSSVRLGPKDFLPLDSTISPGIAPFLISAAQKDDETLWILNPESLCPLP